MIVLKLASSSHSFLYLSDLVKVYRIRLAILGIPSLTVFVDLEVFIPYKSGPPSPLSFLFLFPAAPHVGSAEAKG